ncbi:MAG: hypothetical protein M3505_06030 [Verrucomicrobiota bacterium]|nr:hypothetical protein [Verrucomicrobiota bacterium]
MSTVEEIQAAIRQLSPTERAQLADSLPTLLPELDGDAEWERIIRDPRPRPALTRLGDEVEAAYRANPDQFCVMSEEEFDKHE